MMSLSHHGRPQASPAVRTCRVTGGAAGIGFGLEHLAALRELRQAIRTPLRIFLLVPE